MANPAFQQFTGTTSCDITPLATILVRLAPNAQAVMRYEMPGVQESLDELGQNLAGHAASIDLSADVQTKLATCNSNLNQVRAALVVVNGMHDTLVDTEAKLVHDREVLLSRIAKAAQSAAKSGDPSLITPFAETVAYIGQVAEKAAQTRKKNQEAAEGGTTEPAAQKKASKKASKSKAKAEAPKPEAPQAEAPEAEAIHEEDTPPPSLRAA